MRVCRWVKTGVPDKIFEALQHGHGLRIWFETASLNSTSVGEHPDGMGALKTAVNRLAGPRQMEHQDLWDGRD